MKEPIAEYETIVKRSKKKVRYIRCGVCKRSVTEGRRLTFRLYEEHGYLCTHS